MQEEEEAKQRTQRFADDDGRREVSCAPVLAFATNTQLSATASVAAALAVVAALAAGSSSSDGMRRAAAEALRHNSEAWSIPVETFDWNRSTRANHHAARVPWF